MVFDSGEVDVVLIVICVDVDSIEVVMSLIQVVCCLVLYMGGGIVLGEVVDVVCDFMVCIGILIVVMLKVIGCVYLDVQNYFGMLGMYGICVVNMVVQESDLLICCGVWFDDCVIGKLDQFVFYVCIIYMDFDYVEIGKLCGVDVVICGDL